ncbi:MAG: hypothetical protein JJD97_06480 [Gemmatimonadaceae bacterium]|nr:hypothetical protein [Gemmatimonadaceae bacterium]
MKLALTAALLCFGIAPLAAQVGSEPDKSPYQDFTYRQDLAVIGGYFGGNRGSAGVGPQSGPLIGVRYGLHIGGPAELSIRLSRAFSNRNVLDPTKIGAARNLGTVSDHLWIGDLGINVALTGQKSFHHVIPLVGLGVGVARSGAAPDVGGYTFGTGFAIHGGLGLKFVTHGAFSARLDLTDYFWQLSYPGGYFLAPTGGTSVLKASQSQNEWKQNGVITFGISYIFAR